MKRALLAFAVMLISVSIIAQENTDEIKTLFGNQGKQSIGGYGGINTSYGTVAGHDAIFIGGRGAVVLNHSLAIGLGGNGFISETVYDNNLLEDYEFAGGYGGIIIEPIIGAKNPIHVSVPLLIGAGGVGYVKHWGDYNNDGDYTNYDEDSNAFFIFEPGVEVEFNLVKFMRIAVTGSYRLTSNINLKYKDDPSTDNSLPDYMHEGTSIAPSDMLRGFNLGLIMKFGKF